MKKAGFVTSALLLPVNYYSAHRLKKKKAIFQTFLLAVLATTACGRVTTPPLLTSIPRLWEMTNMIPSFKINPWDRVVGVWRPVSFSIWKTGEKLCHEEHQGGTRMAPGKGRCHHTSRQEELQPAAWLPAPFSSTLMPKGIWQNPLSKALKAARMFQDERENPLMHYQREG